MDSRSRPDSRVLSYVGCSLREPWAEPRIVIGDRTPNFAGFLDRDERTAQSFPARWASS